MPWPQTLEAELAAASSPAEKLAAVDKAIAAIKETAYGGDHVAASAYVDMVRSFGHMSAASTTALKARVIAAIPTRQAG